MSSDGSLRYDVCVVGAGLVGLGVARALTETHPGVSIAVFDKEDRVAAHQSSHNSGVLHSGLYYRPGSLKARLAVEGRRAMMEFCETESIPFSISGKLVIASTPAQVPALDELEKRGRANGLRDLRRLDPAGIRSVEPAAHGVSALHVPEAGVVDFPAVADRLAQLLTEDGVEILTGNGIESIDQADDQIRIRSRDSEYLGRVLVNCAGLQSDRVAEMAGVRTEIRVVPFRGEYYTLADERAGLVRGLIYPVPDPRFPFLGVHFTRRIDGSVEVGPNAVLALGREHYRGTKADWSALREALAIPGFRRLARRHWFTGAGEMVRSRSRALYARSARALVEGVRSQDLLPGGAGVRAQAVTPDGYLVDDFLIEESGATVHVLNAPSPGATASLAIGRHVASIVARHLNR